jgi:transposase
MAKGTVRRERVEAARAQNLAVLPSNNVNRFTNNAAERAIRPLAMTRKNFIFLGSDAGGDRAAAMFTILESCKMLGINPEAYLRDVLTRIADHPINRIGDLLPWRWKSG